MSHEVIHFLRARRVALPVTVFCIAASFHFLVRASGLDNPGSMEYVLGPDDQIVVHAVNIDEIQDKPLDIDLRGYIDLPLIGEVQAAGKTVEALQTELTSRLAKYVKTPSVTITIAGYGSHPVSVLGAVNNPGTYKLMGQDNVIQVLSRAGGLRQDAGSAIQVTRRLEAGPLPLPNARRDSTGQFTVASLRVKDLMDAKDPGQNILLKPNDTITVPRAELIYVMGAVHRPGGFVLQERGTMSVLQALSMAEGLDSASAAQRSRIIRSQGANHQELPIDVKQILSGKGTDVQLMANDILFVPTSAAKKAAVRAMEALVQTGTGIAIYHP